MSGSMGQGARSDFTLDVVPIILSSLLCRCLQRGLSDCQTNHSTSRHNTALSAITAQICITPNLSGPLLPRLSSCIEITASQSVGRSVCLFVFRLFGDDMTLYYNSSVSISCMFSQTCRQTDVCTCAGYSSFYKTLN